MSGSVVLVSGGTGFIGRFIVERLLAEGREVAVLGRSPPQAGFFSSPVEFRRGVLGGAIDAGLFFGIGAFVHAGFDHLPGLFRGGEGDDPKGFVSRNLDGSANLFAAAKAAGVRRVAFLSSRAVYGVQEPGATLYETTPPRPDTLYGLVKLACEQRLATLAARTFAVASLRVTGAYGPGGAGHGHKWSGLFDDYLAGRPVTPRVATEVHGEDVAQAVALILGVPAGTLAEPVFNISDLAVDRRDLLAVLRIATACSAGLPDRADPSGLNVMATRKIAALGWRPAGLPKLEAFVRDEAKRLTR